MLPERSCCLLGIRAFGLSLHTNQVEVGSTVKGNRKSFDIAIAISGESGRIWLSAVQLAASKGGLVRAISGRGGGARLRAARRERKAMISGNSSPKRWAVLSTTVRAR